MTHSELAFARSRNPASVPSWLTSSMGLRPTRSEARPSSGPDTSWQAAYVETSEVATKGLAP